MMSSPLALLQQLGHKLKVPSWQNQVFRSKCFLWLSVLLNISLLFVILQLVSTSTNNEHTQQTFASSTTTQPLQTPPPLNLNEVQNHISSPALNTQTASLDSELTLLAQQKVTPPVPMPTPTPTVTNTRPANTIPTPIPQPISPPATTTTTTTTTTTPSTSSLSSPGPYLPSNPAPPSPQTVNSIPPSTPPQVPTTAPTTPPSPAVTAPSTRPSTPIPSQHISTLMSETVPAPIPGTTLLGDIYPSPAASDKLFIANDMSNSVTRAQWNDPDSAEFTKKYETTWSYCSLTSSPFSGHNSTLPLCPAVVTSEQRWQMGWFGAHVVPGAPSRALPDFLPCVHLPPAQYTYPKKARNLPAISGNDVPWSNLGVQQLEDLKVFNLATPKNLYHFDAPRYDIDALDELSTAAPYIPFASKIRLVLDVGAGGGSLGLLLKQKYDIQTLSTIFADWPYCEYITERGGHCILLDVMESLPFAKFSYDVVHLSWVYHGQDVDELRLMYHELNRVIRPGGYLWMRGGWSKKQVEFLTRLLTQQFGYKILYEETNLKPAAISQSVFFGSHKTLPYEVDWIVILLKPIQAVRKDTCQTPDQAPDSKANKRKRV